MWTSRSHVLAPLGDKTDKSVFQWTPEMDKAFIKMKKILTTDALYAYPDHKNKFVIYTDASDFQLGAVIFQHDRLVAYYSKKLNKA